jgi:hypothetical protein
MKRGHSYGQSRWRCALPENRTEEELRRILDLQPSLLGAEESFPGKVVAAKKGKRIAQLPFPSMDSSISMRMHKSLLCILFLCRIPAAFCAPKPCPCFINLLPLHLQHPRRSATAVHLESTLRIGLANPENLSQVASLRFKVFNRHIPERDIYLDTLNRLAQGGSCLVATTQEMPKMEEEPQELRDLRELLAYQWITQDDFERKREAIMASSSSGYQQTCVVGAVDICFPPDSKNILRSRALFALHYQ